jgi:hypothetical protein
MKKCINSSYTLILFIFSFGCHQNTQNQKKEQNVQIIVPNKIDEVFGEVFMEEYPTFQENNLTKELALESVLEKFDSLKNKGLLNDFPLKIWYVMKNPYGEGALIHLHTFSTSNKLLSDKTNFDLVAFISEEEASKVKEGEFYYVYGKNFNRIDKIQVGMILSKVFHQDEPEIISSTEEFYELRLGVILCEADSLVRVK